MKTSFQNPGGQDTNGTPVLRNNTAEGGQTKPRHGSGALHMEARKVEAKEPKAGGDGQRWAGRRVNLGKGGQVLGKRTGFAHVEPALTRLRPGKSTQVVDFPHLSVVKLFSGRWERTTEARRHRGDRDARNVTGCYALFREVSRKSTKVRTDQARKSSMLRIFTGGTNFSTTDGTWTKDRWEKDRENNDFNHKPSEIPKPGRNGH